MHLIIHYFICFIKLSINSMKKVILNIKKLFVLPYKIMICFILLHEKSPTIEPKKRLKDFYPDNGKLCQQFGFMNKDTEYDLSVIIPMYNVSDYIVECVKSVLEQVTEYSFELLLVDDGSTDDTYKKVSSFSADSRVKLFRQENSGQSVARNLAIYNSNGKYIMFVDGDDILMPNAIQLLVSKAIETNSDIAEGKYVWFYNSIPKEAYSSSTDSYVIESYKKNPKFVLSCAGYSFAKVYKRSLWVSLRFPEHYIFEDIITKYVLKRKANQIVLIENNVYAYRYNNSSSTHGQNNLKKLDSIWVIPKHIELCRRENVPFDDVFYILALGSLGFNIIVLNLKDKTLKEACFFELRQILLSIQQYRSHKMPLLLKLLERAILTGNISAWEYIVDTIFRFGLLKKYRELD